MKKTTLVSKWPAILALLAITISPLSAFVAAPSTASAAPNGDVSDEIIYIDVDGWIRVIDPQWTGNDEVRWVSPSGGWRSASLGDVNNDNDMEILAIGRESPGVVKIAVFDPVIASGATDPNKEINGIPWDTLYYNTFAGEPEIILGGDFDAGINGDEMLYTYQDAAGVSQVVVMNASKLVNGKPTGRDWKVHVTHTDTYENRQWEDGAAGNINGIGSAEAALIDSKAVSKDDLTLIDIFDIDQQFKRIDGKNSDSDTIRKVAVGQIIKDGPEEIVIIQSTKPGRDTVRVYRWDTVANELKSDESFGPGGPKAVFLADLTGNGDEEVLILRERPERNGPRLLLYDEWGDDQNNHVFKELSLEDIIGGPENEFRIGAGGDIDGDGKDEIIIGSRTRFVVFTEPDRSVAASTRNEYVLTYASGNDVLLVGDLDKMGYIRGPVFDVDKETVAASVPTGTSAVVDTVQLTNIGDNSNVLFNISSTPKWLKIDPMTGSTPATLRITFDATEFEVGVKKTVVEITSPAAVVNQPFPITFEMTVSPAELQTSPSAANMIYFPCIPPVDQQMEMDILVGGTAGLNFEALILGVPDLSGAGAGSLSGVINGGKVTTNGEVILYDDAGNSAAYPAFRHQPMVAASGTITIVNEVDWIQSASIVTNTIPTTVTIAVNPLSSGSDFDIEHAVMIFVADTRAGSPPDNVEIVPLTMMCAQDKVLAPAVRR